VLERYVSESSSKNVTRLIGSQELRLDRWQ